jgi:hypothetical protein
MSALPRKRPTIVSGPHVAKGHSRHFAPQKNSEPFRCRTNVKSVTDLQFEAYYLPGIAAGMIPLGTGQMAIGIGRRQFSGNSYRRSAAQPSRGRSRRARQPDKVPTIGLLGIAASSWSAETAAFAERLSQLGWIEGRTIAVEFARQKVDSHACD